MSIHLKRDHEIEEEESVCSNLKFSANSTSKKCLSMGEEGRLQGGQGEVSQGKHLAHVGDEQLDVGGRVARAAG